MNLAYSTRIILSAGPRWWLRVFRFYQQASYIIVLRSRADKEIQVGHEALQQFFGRCRDAGCKCAEQTRLVELFVVSVHRFQQTGGKNNQPTPGSQRSACRSILRFRLNADGQSTHIETFDQSRAPAQDRSVVTGINVG